jgi:predicted alpha/beta superfamily hydrolase
MAQSHPRAQLPNSEEHLLRSRYTGRKYQIDVLLPGSYATSQQSYPVVYLLDGEFTLGMASSLTGMRHPLGAAPEVIVVAIQMLVEPGEDFWHLREIDFKVPGVQDAPAESRADLFLATLQEEILPLVETDYRANPNERILYGYSSSGFFTLYTLLSQPSLFRTYLAGSPDTDLSASYWTANDQKMLSRPKPASIDVFISIGSMENGRFQSSQGSYQELLINIQATACPGLRLVSEVYPNEDHGAVGIVLTFLNGLHQCFPTTQQD